MKKQLVDQQQATQPCEQHQQQQQQQQEQQQQEQHQLQLDRASIHAGHLILVNSDNPVRLQVEQQSLEQECAHQLWALLEACNAMDSIVVVSGYRSMAEQQYIYEKSLLENGAEFTGSYVARPGESEHQTGLAVDVGEHSDDVDFICPEFPDYRACLTFKRLAAEYGFIQRYQAGKTRLTNIACEPWHYRYVGYPHAEIMELMGYCLEEYIEYIKFYTSTCPYIYHKNKISTMAIYYVPAEAEGSTTVPILNGERHQVSGNNKDGFIVTVWSELGCEDRDC